MSDSILNKAVEFLGEISPPISPPVVEEGPEKLRLRGTNNYEQLAPETEDVQEEEDPRLQANQELKKAFPNLIFEGITR